MANKTAYQYLASDALTARQRLLESEISACEDELASLQADLNQVYVEQDRRKATEESKDGQQKQA